MSWLSVCLDKKFKAMIGYYTMFDSIVSIINANSTKKTQKLWLSQTDCDKRYCKAGRVMLKSISCAARSYYRGGCSSVG